MRGLKTGFLVGNRCAGGGVCLSGYVALLSCVIVSCGILSRAIEKRPCNIDAIILMKNHVRYCVVCLTFQRVKGHKNRYTYPIPGAPWFWTSQHCLRYFSASDLIPNTSLQGQRNDPEEIEPSSHPTYGTRWKGDKSSEISWACQSSPTSANSHTTTKTSSLCLTTAVVAGQGC